MTKQPTPSEAIRYAIQSVKLDPQPHTASSFTDLVLEQNPHDEGTEEHAQWFEEAEGRAAKAWARF